MQTFAPILLALSLTSLAPGSNAQSGGARPEGSSTVSTTTPALPDDAAFAQYQPVAPGIKPPKATFAPDPKFPDLPADAEQRGVVVMLVGVNAKGRVGPVRVLRSDEAAFEKTAVQTVRTWKFKPAEQAGRPVPVQVTVEMKFSR